MKVKQIIRQPEPPNEFGSYVAKSVETDWLIRIRMRFNAFCNLAVEFIRRVDAVADFFNIHQPASKTQNLLKQVVPVAGLAW